MAYLNDDVYDDGLNVLTNAGNRLDLCSDEPTTYAEATTTYTMGNKTGYVVGAPAVRGAGGREVTCPAVADGVVTTNGAASFWALVDTVGSRLLAAGNLAALVNLSDSGPWASPSFNIGIPAAVSE